MRTVLGVSNISFGLPNRELLNHSFLTMAAVAGLDLAIINPNVASMMDAVRAADVLLARDKKAGRYLVCLLYTSALRRRVNGTKPRFLRRFFRKGRGGVLGQRSDKANESFRWRRCQHQGRQCGACAGAGIESACGARYNLGDLSRWP